MQIAQLPFLDEHVTTVAADCDAVWLALIEIIDRTFSRRGVATYARAIRCREYSASGPRPFDEDSTIPGFRVVRAVPGADLVLEGRHKFSSYALLFRLEPVGTHRTRLRAESRATFPGMAGGAYRLMIVGTGGHVVAMRRLLASVQRRFAADA